MISHGKKVLDGKITDIKSRFGKNAIHVEIEGDGSFIKSLPSVATVTDYNNFKELRLIEKADPNIVLKQIIEKVPVRRFEMVEPSLYDIFIEMAKIDPSELDKLNEAANA